MPDPSQNALRFLYDQTNYETFISIPYEDLEKNLVRLKKFLHFMGDPQKKYPVVHVAGTKGKGSVCMILEQILRRGGYRTGLFTSPHLLSLYERFTVNGSPCSEEDFVSILSQIKKQWDDFCAIHTIENQSLTFFEWTFLFALDYFAHQKVDIVLLETGLGGRFDATNVSDPILSIITSISFDHQEQLGSDLWQIAREKAGIIKPNTPIVSGLLSALDIPQNNDYSVRKITKSEIRKAREEIQKVAKKNNAPLYEILEVSDTINDFGPHFYGHHQRWNLEIVLKGLAILRDQGFPVAEKKIRSALADLHLPSRIEILSESPLFIIDGAHNRMSAAALCDTLRTEFSMKPISKKILLFGASREKDVEGMFMEFITFFDEIHLTEYEGSRAIPTDELYDRLIDLIRRENLKKHPILKKIVHFDEEILSILRPQTLSSSPLYCISGSFYLAARALASFQRYETGKTCSIISLGCPKNQVDSEAMIGRLIAAGYRFQTDPVNVDLLVVNTCGFLQSAQEEAFDEIRKAIALKNKGQIQHLIVAGCLIKARGAELTELFPAVDLWLSPFDENRIVPSIIDLSEETKKPEPNHSPVFLSSEGRKFSHEDEKRRILTYPHVAFLKIADGCDRFCSYCSIPSIRGRYISKSKEAILEESKRLADSGVRELVLIAQETTFWGNDLYGQPRLAELLSAIRDRNEFDWIRVLYSYPLFFDDDLIALFNGGGKKERARAKSIILPYIDLPLQHCNNDLLKKMNRRVGKEETEDLLARLQEGIEDLVLRTTFIVGFPGETEDQFTELIEFVKKWKFERAGSFIFSPEPGTRAANMEDQIPDRIKRKRHKKFVSVLEILTEEYARSRIGSISDVMIDECSLKGEKGSSDSDSKPDMYTGRTFGESPDIDPLVYITGYDLPIGEIIRCEFVDSWKGSLIAVPVLDDL